MGRSEILAVGPRELPESGTVELRVDVGSGGGGGQRIMADVNDLRVDERDSGEGTLALYAVRTYSMGDTRTR